MNPVIAMSAEPEDTNPYFTTSEGAIPPEDRQEEFSKQPLSYISFRIRARILVGFRVEVEFVAFMPQNGDHCFSHMPGRRRSHGRG